MADAVVVAAVKSRQESNWTTATVRYPNTADGSQRPTDVDAFVEVDFPVATSDQASLGAPGNNLFRDFGTIRFIVNIKSWAGYELANQYIGELANLFRAKQFGGVTTYAPSPPVFLGVDGEWASWSCAVPYKYDHQE